MKMKLAKHLILTIPSNTKPPLSLQPIEKSFSKVSTPVPRSQKAQKPNAKVRKKLIKVNTNSKNIQRPPEG